MDNAARDHRIRFLFSFAAKSSAGVGGHSLMLFNGLGTRDWNGTEVAMPSLTGSGYLRLMKWWISDLGKRIVPYEMLEEGSQIAITLLRCVENVNMQGSQSL